MGLRLCLSFYEKKIKEKYLSCFFCLCRCNLASVVLQLLALKIPNVLTFDFMSKPSPGE